MTTLRQRVVALLTAATTALAITACSGGSTPTANGSIDVLSWWTSTSESSALNILVDRYEKQNPGASVDEIAVVGGGGSQAHVVLATRIAQGDPPDVWQSLVGGNITAWHNAGAVGDVSSLFTDEVKAQLPEDVLSSVSVDGKQYAVPLSAHRANVLMYNRDVLKSAGIAEPGEGYTLEQFLADLDALKASGTTPLCVGGADSISTAGLFESVLLATIGKEGWERIEADRFDWSGQEVQTALNTFGRLIDYTDATGKNNTWSEASGRLAAGECGFYQMNDSAFAESTALNDDSGAPAGAVVEDGAVIVYQKGMGSANVSEALLAVGFTPPPATSRVTFTILVNGNKADFTSPIRTGDTLEVAFTPLESLNAAPAPTDENGPAASAILGSIAARAPLTQEAAPSADTADNTPQQEVSAQSGTVSIDALMRYD